MAGREKGGMCTGVTAVRKYLFLEDRAMLCTGDRCANGVAGWVRGADVTAACPFCKPLDSGVSSISKVRDSGKFSIGIYVRPMGPSDKGYW